jgi:serine/threonine protein kinase
MPITLSLKLSDLRTAVQYLQYQLLEKIGAGGQGVVWSAIDQSHNRIVAIKFSEASEAEGQKQQDLAFEQQCKHLVLLRHPNILPLYDFGTLQGLRYLVSLYIPGGSLFEQLKNGQLPINIALKIAARIAAALDYLHGQGIIHRDLKPGNVLVDLNQHIYVADFGLARMLSDSTQVLHTGHGTPPYSPPEQHSRSEITIQSDIFSFGVMLYEFFTGHLPWNGEKTLGIQQLYSREEIPDPREDNPDLPDKLVKALRQFTAAQPAVRPKTASEAMQMLYYVFNLPPPDPGTIDTKEETSPLSLGADELMKRSLAHWEPSGGTVPLSLTKFALVELEQKRHRDSSTPENVRKFMLHSALAYGYSADFWWKKVEDPLERLRIGEGLINHDNETFSAHTLEHLLHDPEVLALKATLPSKSAEALLRMAARTKNEIFKWKILEFLRLMARPPAEWRASWLEGGSDTILSKLASEDSSLGDQAASLIGALRSTKAVSGLLKLASPERRTPALLLIQDAAGSLPPILPAKTRLSLAIQQFANRLTTSPFALLRVYGLAAVGTTLGTGLQVYLTYRLPNYMDLTRIGIAVERGLFMGLVFGFGIFITRLLAELVPFAKSLPRAVFATLTGGFILTTGLLLYDLLFLNTLPGGFLFILGCLMISAGYALGGIIRPALFKMFVSFAAIFGALAGTWYGHIFLSASLLDMSPIFYYEYTWSPIQILATMLAVSLPMAVFGQLGKFSLD